MNCTECSKAKQDLQTGDCYCQKKGCLVGQQEDCKEKESLAKQALEENRDEKRGRDKRRTI